MGIKQAVLKKYWDVIVANGDQKRIDSQSPPQGVTTQCDISYVNDSKWEHYLDVYYPEDNSKNLPVIIDIHGGGWMYGKKEINKYYNMVLASKGYVVFSINYHLVPQADIGVQLQDCMLAMKWIKEHISEYNGDKNNVFLTGDSAGGFLASFTAALCKSEKLRMVFDTVDAELNFNALTLTSPVCYMDVSGVTGVYTKVVLGKEYKKSGFYGYVNLDKILDEALLPPTFLITSKGDMLAHDATIRAYNDLQNKGVECKLHDYPEKNLAHVFSVVDPFVKGADTIDEVIAFFKKYEI